MIWSGVLAAVLVGALMAVAFAIGQRAAAIRGTQHLARSASGEILRQDSATLQPDINDRSGTGWFDTAFGNKDAVSWDVFWVELDKLVHDPQALGDERWQYYKYKLQLAGPEREKFQSFISQAPGLSILSRVDWHAACAATNNDKLAELLKLGMTSAWSTWVNGGQDMGQYTPIVQAKSGLYIKKWRVGLADTGIVVPGEQPKTVTIVVSLQGQASDGTWLSTLQARGRAVRNYHVEEAAEGSTGFRRLNGMGSGWFIGFLNAPTATDNAWTVDADQLSVPQGRVVGYQLRAYEVIDTARFLFRPVEVAEQQGIVPDTQLVKAAFISHTGSDAQPLRQNALELVTSIHTNLVHRRVATFYDAACLSAGVHWDATIKKWVKQSKVVVVVLTPNFPTRKWTLYELSEALKPVSGRVVVPVLFGVTREDLKPSSTLWKSWRKSWAELAAKRDPMLENVQPEKLLGQLLDKHQAEDCNHLASNTAKNVVAREGIRISEIVHMRL